MNTLEIIRQIIAEKQAKKVAPCHALNREIWQRFAQYGTRAEMNDQLNELCAWNEIISHSTINDVAFEETIIENEEPIKQAFC